MLKTKPRIGPLDHGRRMSLKKFEPIAIEEGYIYELARGTIVVSDVPNYPHMMRVAAIRNHLVYYKQANPRSIFQVLGTMECKLLIWDLESERHPDIAVYLVPPSVKKGRQMWTRWVPELVIEVVSLGSVDRDYIEKREEYWALGVKEYWIVDARRQQILVLRRGRSQWIQKELKRGDTLETKLLPGFKLACDEIFDAAGEQEDEID
ncbi:MAG TPA: Uma2 family endonuclease [Planctomycetaceae bacterium]|nr:Uma2 family endonuclease [Planctomycetaceae bacterium]